MKTLDQIVAAVRSGETVDHNELRQAVAAFDVLLAQLDLASDYKQLQQYFIAADAVPRVYLGDANDPDNPGAVAWYKAMHRAGQAETCEDCGKPLNRGDHELCVPF